MPTVKDDIKSALRLIGVYSYGEDPSSDEINDALSSYRRMLAALNLENLMVYQTEINVFDFIAGQQEYIVGPAGDWVMDRPTKLSYAYVRCPDTPNADLPLTVVTDLEFSTIITKDTDSPLPMYVNDDMGWPDKRLSFWPIPNDSSYKAVLYTPKLIKYAADDTQLTDSLEFPEGYNRCFVYNLALELAPEYGKIPNDLVLRTAIESKALVKRFNTVIDKMVIDQGALPRKKSFNWITGY